MGDGKIKNSLTLGQCVTINFHLLLGISRSQSSEETCTHTPMLRCIVTIGSVQNSSILSCVVMVPFVVVALYVVVLGLKK